MKTYEEINDLIEKKQVVVMTAEEITGYVEKKDVAQAARDVDVVTTATFGPLGQRLCPPRIHKLSVSPPYPASSLPPPPALCSCTSCRHASRPRVA